MADLGKGTEMDFWTETTDAATTEVAAAGKKEAFMRLWRDTTFWDVTRLDATGNAAVKAAYLMSARCSTHRHNWRRRRR